MTDPKVPNPQGTHGDGGDICGCHNSMCCWHHVGGATGAEKHPTMLRTPQGKELSTQTGSRAGVSAPPRAAFAADGSPGQGGGVSRGGRKLLSTAHGHRVTPERWGARLRPLSPHSQPTLVLVGDRAPTRMPREVTLLSQRSPRGFRLCPPRALCSLVHGHRTCGLAFSTCSAGAASSLRGPPSLHRTSEVALCVAAGSH